MLSQHARRPAFSLCARAIAGAALVAASWGAHAGLHAFHARACRASLVRIVLFGDSSVCRGAGAALSLIERSWADGVHHALGGLLR